MLQMRLYTLVVVLIAVISLLSCDSKNSAAADYAKKRAPASVVLGQVELRDISDELEAIGTLEANESVLITASVTDYVSTVNFEDGQHVDQGDILVTLTNDEQTAELEEARANLLESTRQLNRLTSIGNNLASRSEIDIAQATVEANRGRLNAIQARLKDRIVTAPFTGVLSFRRISIGSLISPGDEITLLQDISVLNLDFSVPEVYLGNLKQGISIKGTSPSWPDLTFDGEISFIDNQIDPATRAVLVRAKLPNPEFHLRPGMLINVSVPLNKRKSLVIPEGALLQLGSRSSVYLFNQDSTVVQKNVKVTKRFPGYVAIEAGNENGVKEGDKIVIDGALLLRPGMKVTQKDIGAEAPSEKEGSALK